MQKVKDFRSGRCCIKLEHCHLPGEPQGTVLSIFKYQYMQETWPSANYVPLLILLGEHLAVPHLQYVNLRRYASFQHQALLCIPNIVTWCRKKPCFISRLIFALNVPLTMTPRSPRLN